MDLPSLTNVLVFFEDKLAHGRSQLLGNVQNIATLLVTFEVVFAGLYLTLGTSADIRSIARKILTIGFFFYVILYYGDILRWTAEGFLYAGEKAGSGTAINFATLRDPAKVFIHGMQIAKPAADKLFADIGASYFGIPSVNSLMLLICLILTVFSFAIISIQVFITYLEYLLIATAGFILVPFGIFRPTAFIAERVFGAVIAFGVKLMIIALIIGISDAFLDTLTLPTEVTWKQSIELAVIALALAFLSLHAPGVAQSLLSGTPQLTFGTIATSAAATGFMASKAASNVSGGASATLRAAGAMHGNGVAAAASVSSVAEEKGALGKAAKMASKASLYAVGGAGGLVAGAAKESSGQGAYESSRDYRKQTNDSTLKRAGENNPSAEGIKGNFNAGKFSVAGYRDTHSAKEKSKAEKNDQNTTKNARQEATGAGEKSSNSESKSEQSSKEKK
jgi:type IV secretion system protein TrbL